MSTPLDPIGSDMAFVGPVAIVSVVCPALHYNLFISRRWLDHVTRAGQSSQQRSGRRLHCRFECRILDIGIGFEWRLSLLEK